MPLKSRLKVERLGVLVFSIFYAVAGMTQSLLLLADFRLIHIGFLAVLSFAIAYGLIKMRRWSVWLVIAYFFPAATFGTTVLYSSVTTYSLYPSMEALLLHLALVLYAILCFTSFVYVVLRRKNFQ